MQQVLDLHKRNRFKDLKPGSPIYWFNNLVKEPYLVKLQFIRIIRNHSEPDERGRLLGLSSWHDKAVTANSDWSDTIVAATPDLETNSQDVITQSQRFPTLVVLDSEWSSKAEACAADSLKYSMWQSYGKKINLGSIHFFANTNPWLLTESDVDHLKTCSNEEKEKWIARVICKKDDLKDFDNAKQAWTQFAF